MRGKILKAFVLAALAGALAASAVGCAGKPSERTLYDIATERGFEGDEGEWYASVSGGSSEARLRFEEARQDGYEGTFVEFLKDTEYGQDDTASVNAALLSSVEVLCNFDRAESDGGDYASGGSGVIYSFNREAGDAYVITNFHVIYSAKSDGKEAISHISDEIYFFLYGDPLHSSPVPATYIGGSMEKDIAVLRTEGDPVLKRSAARSISAADSDAITVGERVYAIGNADLKGISVVSGVVSVDAEYVNIMRADGAKLISMLEIRTDAAVNHGNSGGGLFNADGKLVGIVNARSDKTDIEQFGYAIPANLALAVARNIIDNSRVNLSRGACRATLGVTISRTDSSAVYDEESGKLYQSETIVVAEVAKGSMASGSIRKGDRLISIRIGERGEKFILRRHMLETALFDVRKGDTVEIWLLRGNDVLSVKLTFGNDADFQRVD